jgi:hypothetical protein
MLLVSILLSCPIYIRPKTAIGRALQIIFMLMHFYVDAAIGRVTRALVTMKIRILSNDNLSNNLRRYVAFVFFYRHSGPYPCGRLFAPQACRLILTLE